MKRDFYDVLGVSKNASADDIKKAYRKLARKYHPDSGGNTKDNVEKFHEVQEAYDVLSDKEKRKNYDQFGHAAQNFAGAGAGGHGGYRTNAGGFDFSDIFSGMGGGNTGGFGGFGGIADIFEQMRAGQAARPHSRPHHPAKGKNIEYAITIGFMEAVNGAIREISLTITDPNGSRRVEKLSVKIPAGTDNGGKIRLRGKGQHSPGGTSGDLILTVNVTQHPYFKRDGLDILMDLPVTVTEAALGAQVEVPTLSDRTVVNVPPGSPSGRKLRLKGRGVKSASATGDMYLILKIVMPDSLDEKSVQLLKEFGKLNPQTNIRNW